MGVASDASAKGTSGSVWVRTLGRVSCGVVIGSLITSGCGRRLPHRRLLTVWACEHETANPSFYVRDGEHADRFNIYLFYTDLASDIMCFFISKL